jgi:hypothetical protein
LLVGSNTSLGTGSVTNDGGLGTATGQHVINVEGDYSQGAAGTLTLSFGGTAQGSTYDYVAIGGKGELNGMLAIDGLAGFAPPVGQQFSVVQAAGGISGTFAGVTSPAIKLVLSYDATHCYATVSP